MGFELSTIRHFRLSSSKDEITKRKNIIELYMLDYNETTGGIL